MKHQPKPNNKPINNSNKLSNSRKYAINAQIPPREAAPKETFIEVIERRKTPDMAAYMALGVNISDRVDSWRSLYRVRYDQSGAVRWEFLACVHVRLVCFEVEEDGQRVGVFATRNRSGHPFWFRLREKDFENTRAIAKAFGVASGPDTFIFPGKVRATLRAFIQLRGEQIPA